MDKFEKTILSEKETMIHISNEEKEIYLWTHDACVYKRFFKLLGEPTEKNYSSKANDVLALVGWKYNYETNREEAKKILSVTGLLPRSKV